MSSKTLLVLGAGVHQVPLIRRAVEHGCRVVTADYLPDNVGHRLSHDSVDASTVDVAAVLGHARRLRIDGVVTIASDMAVPTVAAVARALGLAGPSPETAAALCDKSRFRALQHASGLDAPRYAVATDADQACAAVATLPLPLLCKPVDTSGSRGITMVGEHDTGLTGEAFEAAARHSRSGKVCLEEYVEGTDVSGDGFLSDGYLNGVVVTSKHTRGFVVAGHALPTHLDAAQQRRVARSVELAAAAAGYRNGPVDFDVRLSPERAVVIEMSPRLGGNGIPALAGYGTDGDLLRAAVRAALGEDVALPATVTVGRPCGSVVLGAEVPGRLATLATTEEVRRAVPEVFDVTLAHGPGDVVAAHTHGGAALGQALFAMPPGSMWADLAARIHAALAARVEATSRA